MIPGIEQRQLVARDGTQLGYQIRGPVGAPCVVLANGLGGTYLAFRALYEALTEYRVVCWDYRGVYSSGPSPDPRANTIVHQVEDLIEILDHEKIGDFVIAGWSMGVQVAFETIRRHRARVRGMYAINGTYGHPFRTIFGSRMIGQMIPSLVKIIKSNASLVETATKKFTRSPDALDAAIGAMKRFGLVSPTVDVEVFRAVAAGFQHIDWTIYSDLLTRLDEHDASDMLSTIDVPVAIVTGDKDLMTPPSTAELLHRSIRGSRLVVIAGGSHYTPVEFPAILIDELGRLLDRVPGWERHARGRAGAA
jgi:pimeloyl-ACP methyl ester carboxylesterase